MSEPTHNDDHWRRLAAELGLDVGPAPEQPAVAEPPASEVAHRPLHSEPRSSGRPRRPEPAVENPVEPCAGLEPTEVEEPPPLPPRGRRGRPVPAPIEDGGLFEDDSPNPTDAESEASDDEAAAVTEDGPDAGGESADGAIDEQTGKRRRRRRSRRKKKPGEPAAEGAVESPTETVPDESPAPSDDDDEEPTAEVVRNWNVPSWDELIGSLHRPER